MLLYFDFWHPDLSADERRALLAFETTRRRFTGGAVGAGGAGAPPAPPFSASVPAIGLPGGVGGFDGLGSLGGPPAAGQLVSSAAAALLEAHLPRALADLAGGVGGVPPRDLTLHAFRAVGRRHEAWHWLALRHGGDRRAMDAELRTIHETSFGDS